MRFFAVLGMVLLIVLAGLAIYAYAGFYNVGATDAHMDIVQRSLESVMHRSVERHASEEVGDSPSLDDPQMIRTGAQHYREEGCIHCHGAPGKAQAEFARHMRPQPPAFAEARLGWSDAELFWIMKHGIKSTGMPAFGPTHEARELWAMVSFVRRLPEMSAEEFARLSGSTGDGSGGH